MHFSGDVLVLGPLRGLIHTWKFVRHPGCGALKAAAVSATGAGVDKHEDLRWLVQKIRGQV